jgi:hypothetical protein
MYKICAIKNRKQLGVWCMPVIPALRRLRQEDLKFETRKGNIERPCVNKQTKQETKPKRPKNCIKNDRINSCHW